MGMLDYMAGTYAGAGGMQTCSQQRPGGLFWAADRRPMSAGGTNGAIMSVRILRADGPAEELEDNEELKYSYQVSQSGTLVILEAIDEGRWLVRKEISASRWNEVSGRRYIGDTGIAGGVEGGKAEGRPKTKLPQRV